MQFYPGATVSVRHVCVHATPCHRSTIAQLVHTNAAADYKHPSSRWLLTSFSIILRSDASRARLSLRRRSASASAVALATTLHTPKGGG
jgi:hypothetical protein